MLNRRSFLAGAATLVLTAPVRATGVAVKFANTAPGALSSAPYAIAVTQRFFAAEGIDPEFMVIAGGANTVAQVARGTADIGLPGNEPVIIAKQEGRDPLPVRFFYNACPTNIWQVVVLKNSRIKSVNDLKGCAIGIFAPSASNVPQLRAMFRKAGLNPDKELKLRTVGLGAGALNALTTGVVDAVALYDTEHAGFEVAGVEIRRLPLGDLIQGLFSNGLLAREEWFSDLTKRKVLIGFGRAYAKASLFMETNPEAAVRAVWEVFPKVKPTGIEESQAMQQALLVVQSRIKSQRLLPGQNGLYGAYQPKRWQDYIDLLSSEKVIERPVKIDDLYTNDLIQLINQFDKAEIVRLAKAAK